VIEDPRTAGVFQQAALVAPTNMSVLVVGETGVGKELVARAVHQHSRRSSGPFIAVNCGALPQSLLESEIFGHERGAFTGATESRQGLIEASDGGTLFLDEVGELPLDIQVKLLRVLEDWKLRRVGGRREKSVDVRYIAATNRDLEEATAAGAFRADLYFRLNGMTLEVPPLRERPLDVEPLALTFAARAAEQLGRPAPNLAPETLEALRSYDWPGNVRELRNAVERGVVLCTGPTMLRQHLPARVGRRSPEARDERPAPGESAVGAKVDATAGSVDDLRRQVSDLERRRLLDAIERCSGNQTRAAALLGISRRTLINRLNEFGLPRPRKRAE
jgi:DNA-binding NtrC family response regulator